MQPRNNHARKSIDLARPIGKRSASSKRRKGRGSISALAVQEFHYPPPQPKIRPSMGSKKTRCRTTSRTTRALGRPSPAIDWLDQSRLERLHRRGRASNQKEANSGSHSTTSLGKLRGRAGAARASPPCPPHQRMGQGTSLSFGGLDLCKQPIPVPQQNQGRMQMVQTGIDDFTKRHFESSYTNGPVDCRTIWDICDFGQRVCWVAGYQLCRRSTDSPTLKPNPTRPSTNGAKSTYSNKRCHFIFSSSSYYPHIPKRFHGTLNSTTNLSLAAN